MTPEGVVALVALLWVALIFAANWKGGWSLPSAPPTVWPKPCVGCRRWRVPEDPSCCAPTLHGHHEGGPFR